MHRFGRSMIVAALGILASDPAFAVPPGGISTTALMTCEYRALAAQHLDPTLRNKDLLAGKFCEPVRLPREYEFARDVMDTDPESYSGFFYVNARTRHIDAMLEQAAAAGSAQVVSLGAGYDSRAYRYHAAWPKLEFFEVDLPATSSAKQAAVERALGALPGHVHYAPIDFNTQTLKSVLSLAGYDAKKKTFFILEGVTMYVVEPGVGTTLDFIAHNSAPGSRVVYDYILRRVVDGDSTGLYAAAKDAKGVASLGEPFVTGWTPAEAAAFASAHGLRVVDDLDADALTRRYLLGSSGKPDGRIPEWYRIIDAIVP